MSVSLYCLVLILCSDKHQNQINLTLLMTTYKKRGCLHLPVRLSWPTTAPEKNRQRNTHVEVYRYTVKCAYEDTRILAAHYGVWYTHPVELPLQCSCSLFDCGSFESPKTKRDNAFPICSAPPGGSILFRGLHSHDGQIAGAKIQRKKIIAKENCNYFLYDKKQCVTPLTPGT